MSIKKQYEQYLLCLRQIWYELLLPPTIFRLASGHSGPSPACGLQTCCLCVSRSTVYEQTPGQNTLNQQVYLHCYYFLSFDTFTCIFLNKSYPVLPPLPVLPVFVSLRYKGFVVVRYLRLTALLINKGPTSVTFAEREREKDRPTLPSVF